MQLTVAEISRMVDGEWEGDHEVLISSFAPIEEAKKGDITFLSNQKYTPYLYTTGASAVLVEKSFKPGKNKHPTLIYVDDVYSKLSFLLSKFQNNLNGKSGIEQPSFVSDEAALGKQVYVGAFSYVSSGVKIADKVKIFPQVYVGENVEIGQGTILYPGARVYANCRIGQNCIIHSGCVIGSDGFGFAPQADGSYKKMPQTGNVIIEDDVEIGANTTIDRATIRSTIIKKGVKLDNLIQIAHNVEIGQNTVIAAQSGVSGSTKIGSQCVVAGQVGIIGHITIAKGTKIGAKSGIGKSITGEDQKWHGIPAGPYQDTLRAQVLMRKLPELAARIAELEKTIKELKEGSDIQ
ncbi:MAG: UDP-3-O-(3-hydroxymyristoyl)glucosamine N-acyltransferase [Bacteroidia bacterium]